MTKDKLGTSQFVGHALLKADDGSETRCPTYQVEPEVKGHNQLTLVGDPNGGGDTKQWAAFPAHHKPGECYLCPSVVDLGAHLGFAATLILGMTELAEAASEELALLGVGYAVVVSEEQLLRELTEVGEA